ncbi:helix-turn-helix domain-containing protein [Candidatus Berkelbacteria bacterium]|nr:helix-turn-helix domain-containing protein [Candidatus Berkelbacteria bacterium]
MTNGFTKTVLRKPRSVGERLRALRLRRKLTLSELEATSRVRIFFIEAIERGDYGKLPATVYCLGFLRAICQVLMVPYEKFEGEFRAERELWIKIHGTTFDHGRLIKAHAPKILLTPKLIAIGSAAFAAALVFGYLWWQFSIFLSPPLLTISEPGTEAKIVGETVKIVGKTSEGATVTINEQPVVPGADGGFVQEIILNPGINELELTAQTRFNKKTTKRINILRERSEAHHEGSETGS